MTVETRYSTEIRAEGRRVHGFAIRYGDVSPTHRERFAPGAFALDGRTRWLNLAHRPLEVLAYTGGGLELRDTADGLTVDATLPEIPAADAALRMIQAGELRGLSVEFHALAERREAGVRVIERADLDGIGLVRVPSYPRSTVEVRARMGRTMRARVPAGRNLACRCSGASCKFARIMQNAMEEVFDEFAATAGREQIAAFGSYDSPLASVSSGTLRGRMLRNGDGEIEIDLPEGVAGSATVAAHDAAGVIVRPVLDAADSASHLVGDVRIYTGAKARAWIVSATDQREGWPDPEMIATPDLRSAVAVPRLRRLWL